MTTEIGKFIIDDGDTNLVTITDVAASAAFTSVIINALRDGLQVKYQQPGQPALQIKSPAVPAEPAPPAPVATEVTSKKRGRASGRASGRATGHVLGHKAAKVEPKAKPALFRGRGRWGKSPTKSMAPVKAKPVEVKPSVTPAAPPTKQWKKGDIVFIAWRGLSDINRVLFRDYRESMGTVAEFRSGTGIRRTVGVEFDNPAALVWVKPDELSAICEYCLDHKGGHDEDNDSAEPVEVPDMLDGSDEAEEHA